MFREPALDLFPFFYPFDFLCYDTTQTLSLSYVQFSEVALHHIFFTYIFSQIGTAHTATLWSSLLLTPTALCVVTCVLRYTASSFHPTLQHLLECSNNDPWLISHQINTANCALPGIQTPASATERSSPASPGRPRYVTHLSQPRSHRCAHFWCALTVARALLLQSCSYRWDFWTCVELMLSWSVSCRACAVAESRVIACHNKEKQPARVADELQRF